MMKEIKYKPTDLLWCPEIPEHWDTLKIKYLAIGEGTLFLDGDWIESKDIIYDSDNGNLRYITTGNIGEGIYKEQGEGFISEETFAKLNCTEVFPGDLLISRLNPPIGRSCIIPDLGKRIVTSVDNVIVRPEKIFLKRYLMYVMTSKKYFEHTDLISRGVTMQRISRSILGDVKLPITADEKEQENIAAFLDDKTTRIDNLISQKEKLIEKLKEERIAIINDAVTKGLNAKSEMKPSGVNMIGEVPKHWEVKRLKFVAQYVQTGNTPPSAKEEYYNGEVNWFTPSDFGEELELIKSSRTISDLAVSEEVVRMFPANSVMIIGIGATLGKVGYILNPASSNQQINAMVFNNETEAIFYCYFLFANRPNIVALTNAATLAILNQSQNKDIPVPVMDIDEMKLIVKKIEESDLKIKTVVKRIEKEIELIKEYKASLINEVVTGKLILN
ncbi:MAG TPA: restriction endonuclease subunit S [Bacteroidia bacterium]|nr:restriction endonuclease subunit S [Bacteroidia bacterium]